MRRIAFMSSHPSFSPVPKARIRFLFNGFCYRDKLGCNQSIGSPNHGSHGHLSLQRSLYYKEEDTFWIHLVVDT